MTVRGAIESDGSDISSTSQSGHDTWDGDMMTNRERREEATLHAWLKNNSSTCRSPPRYQPGPSELPQARKFSYLKEMRYRFASFSAIQFQTLWENFGNSGHSISNMSMESEHISLMESDLLCGRFESHWENDRRLGTLVRQLITALRQASSF